MGNQNNIIQINGNSYNAVTGAIIHAPAAAVSTKKPRNIDGFSTVSKAAVAPAKQPRAIPRPITLKPVMGDIVRSPAKHAVKSVQGSKTLMRHAVAKPGKTTKRTIKAHSHTGALIEQPSAIIIPKSSAFTLNHRRKQLAAQVPQSESIKKFTPTKPHLNPALLATPLATRQAVSRREPAKKEMTTADMLQRALESARGHEQTYTSDRKLTGAKRIAALAAASAAFLVVIGLAGLHGMSAAKLRVASATAGFTVAKPSYQPAGFSLGKITYDPGNAGLHYRSNSDQRAFSIIEKTSQWDSNTLRDMVVAPSSKTYQTIESAGRTLYVDEQHSANWVNGGVWYQVKNENALSDKQLVEIANSL
ncbi:MAG: hypothetical protein QFB86_00115 [Patescibacteria group bacterium]|nr:hypothetical protein [Patescibacteria group bacterium]